MSSGRIEASCRSQMKWSCWWQTICRVSATIALRRGAQNPLAGLHFDTAGVKSAFALLLTKVTKPPYPANISFYTIAGKDTNLCAMSGTGFRKRGEEYDDETNNQWYDRDRVSGS